MMKLRFRVGAYATLLGVITLAAVATFCVLPVVSDGLNNASQIAIGTVPPPDPWEVAIGTVPPPDPWEVAIGTVPPPDPWEVAIGTVPPPDPWEVA